MAGGYAQRLRLRLFLEGVEVPVIAATVQVTPNAPAACSIQLPPLPEGTKLLPRTLVHLYFYDFAEAASPFPVTKTATNSNTNQSPSDYQQGQQGSTTIVNGSSGDVGDKNVLQDIENDHYKLLFGGEMVGFQWTKSASQRSLVLQCMDWSNYWDYAYQWNNTDLFGPGLKAMFSGGSTNLFTDFLEDEGSAILRIFQTPSVQYPNLKGLLGGIVHVLEAIGGSYFEGKQFAGENIFFSIAELKLHITQMITAYEADPTAFRLLAAGYDSLLGRTLGGLGQQVSIRQSINALMGIIFHETYAQCCPRYVPGTGNTPSGVTRKSVRSDPQNAFIATTADGLLQSIDNAQKLLNTQPDQAGVSLLGAATLQTIISNMRATCRDTATRITQPQVQQAKSYYASASTSLDQAQAAAKKWQPGASASIIASITTPLNNAAAQLQLAAGFIVVSSAKVTQPARLNSQIFRPDVWFSAPPRCNVMFPENYRDMQYSRAFLTEPTRLLLKTNDEFFGEDELFDQFYFAPKGFTLKSGSRELQAILSNDLLDHELFTGILPVFEKMGELNIFAARSGSVDGGGPPKIGLAQRSCNFLYFKYRFAARTMQVTGKFNPYIAPGFPGLVIDKYVNAEALALRQQLINQAAGATGDVAPEEMHALMGTHFLANFTEVEHSVSQSGGSTNLNCSYARQYEESVEFLGVIRPDQTVQKRASTDASRVTVVSAINPPTIGSLGPNLGTITAVQETTSAYKAQDVTTGQKLPYYQGPPIAGTTASKINVPVGLSLPASSYGPDVVTLLGNPTTVVQFRAFRVTESVPRYTKQKVDLPAEEYIRPGWYGDIWHPSLIGKAYQEFFFTGSITDQQQVSGTNGGSVGVSYDTAEQALQKVQQAVDADDPRGLEAGLLALDNGSSIQDAVEFLVQTYSYIRANGFDVDEFIRNYTWRPIASMYDMFGSSDLALDADGINVVKGIEGFHSRAFGPYNDLFGLVNPDITNITGIQRGSTAAQRGDTRERKQRAVLQFVAQLQTARAVLG